MVRLERVFDVMGYPDDCKPSLAVFLLEENAYHWWELERQRYVGQVAISWTNFRLAFYEHFYPRSFHDAKLAEFLKLVQGTMTVAQYEHRFIELSRYAPLLVANEEDKCRRFVDGLREEIRFVVTAIGHTRFVTLVQAAMRVEKSIDEGHAHVDMRRQFTSMGGPSQGLSKRGGSTSGSSFSGSRSSGFSYGGSFGSHGARQSQGSAQHSVGSSVRFPTSSGIQRTDRSGRALHPQCQTCGRYHSGPYQLGRSGCYRCGQIGHIMRDCPQLLQGGSMASGSVASQS
ncbi:uncharacterized protein LOC121049795 [Rosa chinensis]|uniref:uncharacterized protein LOC121049795 n=1 Tax=Rosa chinensis TaxID=74649 RepID=UPI001AD91FF3|nr:uncharacterized protein LOC121049795 [Rosa chinensis]